jgi:hypothetical protein
MNGEGGGRLPERSAMSRIKHLLLVIPLLLMLGAGSARAQFGPVPPLPTWGDYDGGLVWHDAAWWWTNRADWVRAHHPEWWGDFDDAHVWRPAWWWWQNRADWVQAHHPEW